jgi:hypothetical protein
VRHLILKPKLYWAVIAILIVLKIATVVSMQSGFHPSILRHVDTALMMVVIIVVVARVRDAGRSGWLAGLGLIFFAIVLPVLLVFLARPGVAAVARDPFGAVPALWLATAGFFAIIIVAGVLKTSHPSGDSGMSLNPSPRQRIEPRFD